MDGFVSNLDLFRVLQDLESFTDSAKLCAHLKQELHLELTSEESNREFTKFCQKFCSNVHGRWVKSNRTLDNFIRKNGDWLENDIIWPECVRIPRQSVIEQICQLENIENVPPPSTVAFSTSSYSPRKPFERLSPKQKKRRIEQVSKLFSLEELTAATASKLATSRNEDLSKVLSHLLHHPEDLQNVQDCIQKKKPHVFSAVQALALIVSLKLSKWQYINLRKSAEEQGVNLYPSYYCIMQAKSECYPSKENLMINESGASIKIQALLDLTAEKLLIAIGETAEIKQYQLISKWGLDGASGQSNYKQRTSDPQFDDSSVFMASLVPIRLVCDGVIVWENDRPSSTLFCRPIMFKFMKETQATVEIELSALQADIDNLQATKIREATVEHTLLMTMIDGKICSYISETSNATCDICKAKPSEMNDLDKINKKKNDENMYKYGLSSLHAWIRCMECLLHIAYRLEFKKWSARGEDKLKLERKKKQIQAEFRHECGLLVDVVKQGAGTTNDGNTARRFFGHPEITARITGIDRSLIEKIHTILQVIASGELVEETKFSDFCKECALLYVKLYPWYYMPSSVHKLLVHGADIIKHFGVLPIGKLSEEASEARNKDFRNFRENHSRKFSRMASNEDIMHSLLLSSDPQLSFLRSRMAKKKKMILSAEALSLLIMNTAADEHFDFIDVDNMPRYSDTDDSE